MNISIQKAIELCGSQSELARMIGAKQQYISSWLYERREVSATFVLPIEKATGGEVARYELRPDLYPPEEYAPVEIKQTVIRPVTNN